MEIRKLHRSENGLVIDLFNKYRIFYKQPSDIGLAEKFIRARLDNGESVIFVALETIDGQETPLGFTQLYPCFSSMRAYKYWILNDLYVEENHRKQGIGEKLIQAALDLAKTDHAAFVELSTATENFTAQRLYEQIGFEKQKPDDKFYTYRMALKV